MEGELLIVASEGRDRRGRSLHRSTRHLKAIGALLTGGSLLIAGAMSTFGGESFPIFGQFITVILILGAILIPISGLYVARTGSRFGGGGEDRFRRGAVRSLLLADWIGVVWSAPVVMEPNDLSAINLVIGAAFLFGAAWLGSLAMGRVGAGSPTWGLLIGIALAELPILAQTFLLMGGEGAFMTILVLVVSGPLAVQLLLLSDFGLMRLDVPAVDSAGEGDGGDSPFEVLETDTR